MSGSSKTPQYDAVIAGAGVVGAALALGLSKLLGWRVALVEKGVELDEPKETNQRALALSSESQTLLTELGVWGELAKSQSYPFTRMFVWDESTDGELEFQAYEQGLDTLGHIVDQFSLQHILQQQLASNSKVDLMYSTEIESVHFASMSELTTSKGRIQTQWVFAADGIFSRLRSSAGIETSQHLYQQQGIVAKVRAEKPHQDTAWQRFLSTGPVALLPLSQNECSIVWTVNENKAAEILNLTEADFIKALSQVTQYKLGSFELLSERKSFPLGSRQAKDYLHENLVLVGDAAHSIHPLAGQGANLGFGDVAALLLVLADKPADDVMISRALRRYERERKLASQLVDAAMTQINSVYLSDNVLASSVRRVGMNFLNSNRFLKSFIAQQAIGR